jgi:hypothetical protein
MNLIQSANSAFDANPESPEESRSLKWHRDRKADRTRALTNFLPLSLTLEGFHVCGGPSL